MRYSIRDRATGRFTVRRNSSQPVVAGRLYEFRGATVRANGTTQKRPSDGTVLRFVTFHKVLAGFVPQDELRLIGKQKVEKYLRNA